MFARIDCWVKGIWRTLRYYVKTGSLTETVEGHLYEDIEVHENVTVTVSRCKDCGKIELGWKRN